MGVERFAGTWQASGEDRWQERHHQRAFVEMGVNGLPAINDTSFREECMALQMVEVTSIEEENSEILVEVSPRPVSNRCRGFGCHGETKENETNSISPMIAKLKNLVQDI